MSLDIEIARNIVKELTITEEDIIGLFHKRGFTRETIELAQLKSIGPDFTDLIHSNIFINKAPPEVLEAITKSKNILIPYFNENNEVVKIKPHKYNLKGDSLDLYCPWPLINKEEKLFVLTEGEFKAIASCQLGVNAVAVPGINTFVRQHAAKLIDFFHKVKPSGIVIAFDNEIKNDPRFPNFKPDYTKRYDSQLYAYINAYLLEREGFKVFICTLPIQKAIEGKCDIDGLLSQGISSKDYTYILANSLSANDYKKEWKKLPESHRSFLERRIDKFFYNGNIIQKFSRYYIRKSTKNKDEEADTDTQERLQEISNFTIKLIQTVRGDGSDADVRRLVRLESNYGNSAPFLVTSDMMSSKSSFVKTIMAKGDYSYSGNDNNLQDIWKLIFLSSSGQIIRKIDKFGYDEDNDMWVFAHGIYKDNKFYPVDSDSIVQVNDDYFRIIDAEEIGDLPAPILNTDPPDFVIKDYFERFKHITDEYTARMFIGWCLSIFFSDLILETYQSFPMLFLDGPQGSGKSSLAQIAMASIGMPNTKGTPLQGSTKVGMRNLATMYSYLPVHFEESRQGDDGTVLTNSFFRNMFDRTTMIKGSKVDGQIITKTLSANCIVSGEEAPIDTATMSRFIVLTLSKTAHKRIENKDSFDWVMKNKSLLSFFGHSILLKRTELWNEVRQYIDMYLEGMKDNDSLSSRNKILTCIVAGVSEHFLGESDEFVKLIYVRAKATEGRQKASQALDVFFSDCASLVKEHYIKEKYFDLENVAGSKAPLLKLAFNGLYAAWEKHYKNIRKGLPIAKEALLSHLMSEPYYLTSRRFRLGDERPQGTILRFTNELPEGLRDMVFLQEKAGGEMTSTLAQDLLDKIDKEDAA